MAFARAVAAGFDIDQMSPLISFANNFGASRLMYEEIHIFSYIQRALC